MTNRSINHNYRIRTRIHLFEQHAQLIEEHEDPENTQTVSSTFVITKDTDLVYSHLRERLGSIKAPLSNIISNSNTNDAIEP